MAQIGIGKIGPAVQFLRIDERELFDKGTLAIPISIDSYGDRYTETGKIGLYDIFTDHVTDKAVANMNVQTTLGHEFLNIHTFAEEIPIANGLMPGIDPITTGILPAQPMFVPFLVADEKRVDYALVVGNPQLGHVGADEYGDYTKNGVSTIFPSYRTVLATIDNAIKDLSLNNDKLVNGLWDGNAIGLVSRDEGDVNVDIDDPIYPYYHAEDADKQKGKVSINMSTKPTTSDVLWFEKIPTDGTGTNFARQTKLAVKPIDSGGFLPVWGDLEQEWKEEIIGVKNENEDSLLCGTPKDYDAWENGDDNYRLDYNNYYWNMKSVICWLRWLQTNGAGTLRLVYFDQMENAIWGFPNDKSQFRFFTGTAQPIPWDIFVLADDEHDNEDANRNYPWTGIGNDYKRGDWMSGPYGYSGGWYRPLTDNDTEFTQNDIEYNSTTGIYDMYNKSASGLKVKVKDENESGIRVNAAGVFVGLDKITINGKNLKETTYSKIVNAISYTGGSDRPFNKKSDGTYYEPYQTGSMDVNVFSIVNSILSGDAETAFRRDMQIPDGERQYWYSGNSKNAGLKIVTVGIVDANDDDNQLEPLSNHNGMLYVSDKADYTGNLNMEEVIEKLGKYNEDISKIHYQFITDGNFIPDNIEDQSLVTFLVENK